VQLAPRSQRNRRIVGAGVVVLMLALVWIAVPVVNRWANATITVPLERLRVAEVTRGNLVRDVSVQGRVVAAVSPTLYAPAPGTITLEVEAGAAVERGQVLAVVDSPQLANELEQARSALQQQTVELDRQRIESRQLALEKRKAADLAEVALVAAEREKRRADQANDVKVISVIDFEAAQDELRKAELAFEHARADARLFDERLAFELRASELAVERQQLLVAELQRQVDALAIRSPVSGIVGDLLVNQKAAVSKDAPVLSVVDLTRFEIDAQVPESYADDLGLGMPAEVLVGGRPYAGTVVAVSPEIIDSQVSTRIRFDADMPPNIRQNQRLTTRILLEERPDVLMLARGQFLDSGSGRVAYVFDGDGLLQRRAITVGARSLSAVEIASGLREGESVVISSVDAFRGADTVFVSD
jgi:HlyD family secretion protein